jgi:hypothetical protein
MKKYNLFLLGIMLFATSCQEKTLDTFDSVNVESISLLEQSIKAFNQYKADDFYLLSALKSGKSAEVTLTKKVEFKRSSGTFGVVPNTGFCDAVQAPYQLVIEGSGIATHLGLFTVRNLACLNMKGEYISPVYGFITAACGSEIHTQMDYAYPDEQNPPNLFYHYNIIGGTGKYQDASGYFLMHGYIDDMSFTWSLTGEGEISY